MEILNSLDHWLGDTEADLAADPAADWHRSGLNSAVLESTEQNKADKNSAKVAAAAAMRCGQSEDEQQ
ncbi:hypothetical protein [Microbulbifer aestuariivivens]|uniref:hypothetical protein n=1 Tax=Microbulbifer aestuariivivens TaxID=1908308 RepID=UPI0031E8DCB1